MVPPIKMVMTGGWWVQMALVYPHGSFVEDVFQGITLHHLRFFFQKWCRKRPFCWEFIGLSLGYPWTELDGITLQLWLMVKKEMRTCSLLDLMFGNSMTTECRGCIFLRELQERNQHTSSGGHRRLKFPWNQLFVYIDGKLYTDLARVVSWKSWLWLSFSIP